MTHKKSDIQSIHYLSPLQEGLLFHALQTGEHDPYHVQQACIVEGELQPELFERAWQLAVQRHQVLRSCFVWEKVARALQVVMKRVELGLNRLDWHGQSEGQQRASLDNLLRRDRADGFSFSKAPLLRLFLIRLGENRFGFVFSLHHLVLDGWSVSLLLKEVVTSYRSLCQGGTPDLGTAPPLEAYHQWLQSRDMDQAKLFWRQNLAGFQRPTFPAADPATGPQARVGSPFRERKHRLSESASAALTRFVRHHGLTPSNLIQAAWALALHHFSGETDVVFGATLAGRPPDLPGSERMLGMFINTLPVRVRVERNPTVLELLREIQVQNGHLQHYLYTPLSKINGWSDVPGGRPLFETLVVMENFPVSQALGTGSDRLRIDSLPLDGEEKQDGVSVTQGRNNYPLTLVGVPGNLFALILAYDLRRIDSGTAANLMRQVVGLLTQMVEGPSERVSNLASLSRAERHMTLVEWNRTADGLDRDLCIHTRVSSHSAAHPDMVAVKGSGRTLTYGALERRSRLWARTLSLAGSSAETPVGVHFSRSPQLVIGMLAVMRSGGVYLPLDPTLNGHRMRAMVTDSGASLVLGSGPEPPWIPECAEWIDLDHVPDRDPEIRPVRVTGAQAAYLIYTSGSTGRPKGTLIAHRALGNYVTGVLQTLNLPRQASLTSLATVSADLGHTALFGSICSGRTLRLIEDAVASDPEELANSLERDPVDCMKIVPSHLRVLLAASRPERMLPRLCLVLGGEALDSVLTAQIHSLAPSCRIVNHYGPTETTVGILTHVLKPGSGPERRAIPLGRPLPNSRAHVLNPGLNPIRPGLPGELFLAGEGLARGYHRQPAMTAARFLPDPFTGAGGRMYRSGDRVRFLPNGELLFLGRSDDQVKIRGFRVEIGEIEHWLRAREGVGHAVVTAKTPGPDQHPRLVAYLRQGPGHLDLERLRRDMAGELPHYLQPSVFVCLDRFPLLSNGKVDRAALPEPERPIQPDGGSPRTETERILSEIWAEVLQCERVGIHENFFDLGGDSILSLLIIARAKQKGIHLTSQQIFEKHTIAALAAVAGEGSIEIPAAASAELRDDDVPLTPIQYRFFEMDQPHPHHWNQSLFFLVRKRLDLKALERSLVALTRRHDALRLRFSRGDRGGWRQRLDPEPGTLFERIDLESTASLPRPEFLKVVEAEANRIQGSLDLAKGPLFRVAYFDLGPNRSSRLLLVAHHLVVDGISWRILLEDLRLYYQAEEAHTAPELPAKTTPFPQWSQALASAAREPGFSDRFAFWKNHSIDVSLLSLPADIPAGQNRVGMAETIGISLDADTTRQLLRQVPGAYRTRINDVLLAALGPAVFDWTGNPEVWVELEGHGRESLFQDVDLSRSVGWFTTRFPVSLPGEKGSPVDRLKIVKERLRGLPLNGMGYGILHYFGENGLGKPRPHPPISFNYMGQLDGEAARLDWLEPAIENSGPERHPESIRDHELTVNAHVADHCLHVSFTYSGDRYRRGTIQRLADGYRRNLRDLVRLCLSPDSGGATPSDFPMARLSQKQLDRLMQPPRWREVEDLYPLSPLQQGILFHELYQPGRNIYFNQLSCRLQGPFDIDAFKKVWAAILAVHPILRTAFFRKGLDRPVQIVFREADVPFLERDWRGSDKDPERRLQEYLTEDRDRGFDLGTAPLMRIALFRIDTHAWFFVWSRHHLLLDGWCSTLLIQEVLQRYGAAVEGRQSVPPEPRPYRDFIAWLQDQDMSEAEDHWRRTLAGFTNPTSPPKRHSTFDAQGYGDEMVRFPESLSRSLSELAMSRRVTLNTLAQAGWALLLARYNDVEDVLFGITVSGRPGDLLGMETMLGAFINSLPLRLRLDPVEPVSEWLPKIQKINLEIRRFEHSPLVDVQGWSDVPRGVPLFDSLLLYENYPMVKATGQAPGMVSVLGSGSENHNHFPLTLIVTPGERLGLHFSFDRTLFEVETIRKMAAHLQTVFSAIALDPAIPLGKVPVLTESERRQLLTEWCGTADGESPKHCLHDLIRDYALAVPDRTALDSKNRMLSYAALDRCSDVLAHHLASTGVGPDEVVGICLDRSFEMVLSILAIHKAGGAYLPLDPGYPGERLSFVLTDASISTLLTRESEAGFLPSFELSMLNLCHVDEILDEVHHEFPGESAMEYGTHSRQEDRKTDPGSLAYVIYTSGSTGRPKGVQIPHQGLANLVHRQIRAFRVAPVSRVLQFASLSFDASISEIGMALGAGAALIVSSKPELLPGAGLERLLCSQAVTHLTLPPSVLSRCRPDDFQGVSSLIVAGEPCSAALVERYSQAAVLFNAYGPSETSVCVSIWRCEPGPDDPPIGRPIGQVRTYVLDRRLRLSPEGTRGMLYVGGIGLARGYHARPDLTADRFFPDPFGSRPGERLYRTGDRVRHLPNGALFYLGRSDHQIKIRGFRVELGEIEHTLRSRPEIRDAVVLAREDRAEDLRLVAYVTVSEGHIAPDPVRLRNELKLMLPDYMVPGPIVVIDRMPLNTSGKIDRSALPEPEACATAELVAPTTATEQVLAGIYADVLGRERVGVTEDFFEMGGHSLTATQIASRISDAFGIEVPVAELFESPTVAGLARRVEASCSGDFSTPAPLIAVNRPDHLPLSFSQQRLWFLDRLEGQGETYNIPTALSALGPLDVAGLCGSLGTIFARHEILRTRFGEADGTPVQIVDARPDPIVPLVDLRRISATEAGTWQPDHLQRIANEEGRRPFDLGTGPLLRLVLLRVSDRTHHLLLNTHHVVADGWSVGVLVRELITLYRAGTLGEPVSLPPLPLQYADYAIWQRQRFSGQSLERQLAFWRDYLAGLPALLELPTSMPRPAVQTYRGAKLDVRIDRPLSSALLSLCRSETATPFMALLAAFKILLYRYAGQNDIAVGTPVANRGKRELEGLIGFFVNTLVLRTRLAGSPSFRELLAMVRTHTLAAYARQDMPFEHLVEILQPERSLSHSPLFQVMFLFQNTPLSRMNLELPGVRLHLLQRENRVARYDLTLQLEEIQDGIAGNLEYNTDLFSRNAAVRMMDHYRRLLAAAVENPDLAIANLPLLSRDERGFILETLNRTETGETRNRGIYRLVEAQAARVGERVALGFGHRFATYGEVNRRANHLAHRLAAQGAGPETVIGLLGERSIDFWVAMLGILKTGGAYFPLDPAMPRERLVGVLDRNMPQQVVVASDYAPFLEKALEKLDLAPIPHILERLIDREGGAENLAYEALPGSLAYVINTSGSTGIPKGATVAHQGMVNHVRAKLRDLGMTESDILAQNGSQSFDVSVWQFLGPLILGGRSHVFSDLEGMDPGLMLDMIVNLPITVLEMVPSQLRVLVEELASKAGSRPGLHRLRWMVPTGEVLPPELCRKWFGLYPGIPMMNTYGHTECSDDELHYRFHEPPPAFVANMPVGRPIGNVRAYLLDRRLEPVPFNVAAEVHIGGIAVGRGYLYRPALTARAFIPDPYSASAGGRLYKTGDLARLRPDGNTEFISRIDFQIKIRGFRVEPGEIESILSLHREVQQAVVVVNRDLPENPRLIAYVVSEPGSKTSEEALRHFTAARLPHYMVPAVFVFLQAMPLNRNGKVDRNALPLPEPAGDAASIQAPSGAEEEIMAGLWSEVLSTERIGVDANFFDLGGHSLFATQVVSRIRDAFRVELPVRALFESPTVALLCERVRALRNGDRAEPHPMVPVPRTGNLPLSYAQQRLWFLDQLEGPSPTYNMSYALRLMGDLCIPPLIAAFYEIVHRHESLRTTFHKREGTPVQIVHQEPLFDLTLVDFAWTDRPTPLSTLAVPETQRLALAEAQRPFNLETGPLLRVCLLACSPEDRVLIVTMHHIISDAWSLGVFVNELIALYHAGLKHGPSPLKPLALQYADYAHWQREWLQGGVLERQLDFWKRRLQGLAPLLALPTDFPRPPRQSYRGNTIDFEVPFETLHKLRILNRTSGVTLFMTLTAGLAVLLARYCGTRDIPIGTSIANRNRREVEHLIGFFINALVLRSQVSPGKSFRHLLSEVREDTLAAYAHQDLPFEQLVDSIHPERSLSHAALAQVRLILQNAPTASADLTGLRVRPMMQKTEEAKFDILLSVTESDEGLRGSLQYAVDLFKRTTAQRMVRHYRTILETVAGDPEIRIRKIDLLGPAERHGLLYAWAAGAKRGEVPETFHQIVERLASTRPEAVAVVDAERTLAYGALNSRSNRLAHGLLAFGVRPEEPVGICQTHSAGMAVAVLAVLKASAAFVPIDPQFPPTRVANMVAHSGIRVMLTERSYTPGELEGTLRILFLDRDTDEWAAKPAHNPGGPAEPQHLAYLMFTSGSTGMPKAVGVCHRSLVNYIHNRRFPLPPGARLATLATVAADLGYTAIFVALGLGYVWQVLPETLRTDPDGLAEYLTERPVDLLKIVPIHLASLLAVDRPQRILPRSCLVLGGETLSPGLVERVRSLDPSLTVINHYGPTEATIGMSTFRIPANAVSFFQGIPIGSPIPNTLGLVLGKEREPAPIGVNGELNIGGYCLARGYLGQPGLTGEKFIPNPFSREPGARLYRTGDLVRRLEDGTILFVGRGDNQVKIRGFRIELGEVEAALESLPGVRQAVAKLSIQANGAHRLVAFAVNEAGPPPDAVMLRNGLKTRLPDYLLPSGIKVVDSLPLLPNGKIDRDALPDLAFDDTPSGTVVQPRTEVERQLVEIWKEVLQVEELGIRDNFFARGGDSILSILVVARARKSGLDVTPPLFFQNQTIEELAQVVNTISVKAEQGRVLGELPLTPVQHWFFEQDFVASHHWNQCLLLEIRQSVCATFLEAAVRMLLDHHDALRLRFVQGETGWTQTLDDLPNETPFRYLDLAGLDESQDGAILPTVTAQTQSSLSLEKGRLVRVVLCHMGPTRSARLLIVIHHLAVDGLSWRILLEDLQSLYNQLLQGSTAELPPKTTSYKAWAERLAAYSATPEMKEEQKYWSALKQCPSIRFPGIHDHSTVVAAIRTYAVELGVPETTALLQEIPPVYNTEINDILLTALVLAFGKWTGTARLLFVLEGHGRENLFENVDLSRTIGWFTSMFPVYLELNDPANLGEAIKGVKERLRSIPRHGIGYGILRYLSPSPQTRSEMGELPQPLVRFNYLGQFDQTLPKDQMFRAARESPGPTRDPRQRAPFILEINGMVTGGRLRLGIVYGTGSFDQAQIDRLGECLIEALSSIVDHCRAPQAGGFTPSDFPDLDFNQDELDELLEEVADTDTQTTHG